MEDIKNIEGAIEAILFVSGDSISIKEIAKGLNQSELVINNALNNMINKKKEESAGIQIVRLGDKVQLATNSEYESYVKNLFMPDNKYVITNAAIETLAIIAYNQPITRGEVEQIRGVSCTYSINALINKGIVCEAGKKDTVGHPKLYKTTDEFLRHFGLESVNDLPDIEQELNEQSEVINDNNAEPNNEQTNFEADNNIESDTNESNDKDTNTQTDIKAE